MCANGHSTLIALGRFRNTWGLFFFAVAFMLVPRWCPAQDVAELARKLAQAAPDTNRVTLLADYAWEISESAPDEATARIQEAIGLAQKLNFKQGEAKAWNALGVVEEIKGNYQTALAHYKKALELRQGIRDMRGVAGTHTNLGNVYLSLGELTAALHHHRQCLNISDSLGDTLRVARSYANISNVLSKGGAYQEAFVELNKARLLLENKADNFTLFRIYTQLGHNRFDLDMFSSARIWYKKSLKLRLLSGDSVVVADGLVDIANTLDEMSNRDSSTLALKLYQRALKIYRDNDDLPSVGLVCNNIGDALKHLERLDEALVYLRESLKIRRSLDDEPGLMETYNTYNDVLFRKGYIKQSLKYIDMYAEIAERIGDKNALMGAYKDYARAYVGLGDFAKAYDYQVKYNDLRFKVIDEKRAQNIETQQALTSLKEREQTLDRERNRVALREAELAKARTFRNALLGGAVLLALLVALLFNRNRIRARANQLLAAKNKAIEMERQRADKLLQNILPQKTAEELKAEGSVKPTYYESVTVMFTDFKNFTSIAESLSPDALVRELDEYFRLFDDIVARHGLEKIKTIGDAYMCAGGLPEPSSTHALDTVRAAIEMQTAMRQLAARKAAEGKPFFEMRAGIHTGPVVAGVVGSRKFAYDIWGDTVNTAARLEQGGEPGRINISESTWRLVRDEIPCVFRGKLPAKNKGEIAMYFVE